MSFRNVSAISGRLTGPLTWVVGGVLSIFLAAEAGAKPAGKGKAKAPAAASTASGASPRVDSAKVRQLYLDGEFDAAIAILEDNLKETRQYRHEDSVFIFKHLGVMYTAQYDTREKGKYFMHRLLLVEPSAKIMDMYASDMIYMIFKNIQEEFEQSRMELGSPGRSRPRSDTVRVANATRDTASAPVKRPAKASSAPGTGKKWIWAGAAAATVAAGVGAYVLMNEEPPQAERKVVRF